MFGYYRFLLATMVLFSHVGIKPLGFDPGVAAVVSFFMLAGYVVCRLLREKLFSEQTYIGLFYLDRLLRIFPLYLLLLALNFVFLLITQYQSPSFSIINVLSHLTLLPLNFFWEYDFSILTESKSLVIPPVWSLALELQAYLLLPWIIFSNQRRWLAGSVSIGIFCIAVWADLYTNRLVYFYLPGVFFMFLLGDCVARRRSIAKPQESFDRHFPRIACYLIAFTLLLLCWRGEFDNNLALETSCGVLLGWFLIEKIARTSITLPANHLLGNMSYALFLSHWLIIRIVDHYELVPEALALRYYALIVLALSTLFSLLLVLVFENRFFNLRVAFIQRLAKQKSAVNLQTC